MGDSYLPNEKVLSDRNTEAEGIAMDLRIYSSKSNNNLFFRLGVIGDTFPEESGPIFIDDLSAEDRVHLEKTGITELVEYGVHLSSQVTKLGTLVMDICRRDTPYIILSRERRRREADRQAADEQRRQLILDYWKNWNDPDETDDIQFQ